MSDTDTEHDAPITPPSTPPDAHAPRVVTFATQWGSYNAGESAAFNDMDADALIASGAAKEGGAASEPAPLPSGGVMVAGLEYPPRQHPPNPQHPEIVQTFDPRVSTQLRRTARDIEADKPGTAAQEDLDRFVPDPKRGAGPQVQPEREETDRGTPA